MLTLRHREPMPSYTEVMWAYMTAALRWGEIINPGWGALLNLIESAGGTKLHSREPAGASWEPPMPGAAREQLGATRGPCGYRVLCPAAGGPFCEPCGPGAGVDLAPFGAVRTWSRPGAAESCPGAAKAALQPLPCRILCPTPVGYRD